MKVKRMCGIAGVKYKNGSGPVGRDLLDILIGINHRGPDSAGMATYTGALGENRYKMRLRLDLDPADPAFAALAEKALGLMESLGARVEEKTLSGGAWLVLFTYGGDLRELAGSLVSIPKVEIHSVGRNLEITKAVGPCTELDRRFGVAGDYGTHGIGHVRLATESRIMVSTSHPFWAFGFADVAVVHNGQLTNYHRLRRRLEGRGWIFTTGNDTELIAVYVADRLAGGRTLRETLDQSLSDFDGTYSFIVSTPTEMGYAKDMLGAKPLVVAETDDLILLASEEVGIQRVLHDPNLVTVEPYPLEVQTW